MGSGGSAQGVGPRASSWMKSEAAGGREAHSRPCPSPPGLSLPFLLLLQGELEVTAHRHPSPARRHPHAGSVSLASRRPILNPRGLLAAHLARLPTLAAGLFVEPSQAALASVFLFRQTNKSRFGYHGRAVRRPTQTEAARLASPDGPVRCRRSQDTCLIPTLALLPSPQGPTSPSPLHRGHGTWGWGAPRLQQTWAGAFL